MSAIGTYEKCQLKAKYKYVDRLPEARSQSANRGVDFHKDIEMFLRGETTSLPDNLSFYHQWLTELKQHEIYPEKVLTLNSRWEEIATDDPERWYKGVLDLLVLREDEAIIYDWKTGKIYPDHHDQRTLYSCAVFAAYPSVRSVRAIHVYVDLRQLREETFHRDQMHDLRKQWNDKATHFLEALKTPEHMIPQPSYGCNWCGYSCRKGGPCRF